MTQKTDIGKEALVLGVFDSLDSLHTALAELSSRQWAAVEVYSPVPSSRIEQAVEPGHSAVRVFTIIGGSVGAIGGLALAIWTSVKWGLITGGKPIVSIPPFLVIGFELALLLGALGTVAGFLGLARLFRFREDAYYDSRFSEDHFGLLISGLPQQRGEMVVFLRNVGATEVSFGDES